MPRHRSNDQPVAIDLGTLLQGLANGGPKQEETDDQRISRMRQSFSDDLDQALDGTCPGNANPRHQAVETAMFNLLKSTMATVVLPEPVGEALVKVLTHVSMHSDGEGGWPAHLAKLMNADVQHFTMLVAGAVLRVAGEAERAGVKLSTGHYL